MDARTPRRARPSRPGPVTGIVMIVGLIAICRAPASRAEFVTDEPARIEAAAFGSPSFSGDGGSSGRTSRRLAVESIPLERMPESSRRVTETAVRSATLFRRLPVETVACDHDLLEFILDKPETLVDVWRVLGISRLALDPAGPGQWRLSDGYGTVGTLRLLHRDRHEHGGTLVFHGRGTYTGPLAPRQLTGSCLVVVHHAADAQSPRGTPRQAVQVDAFLDVEGVGLELVTRTLQPLIVRSAAANLHEICLFVSQFHAAATRNPAGVARLAERMPRTDPEDRRRLVALACGSGAESTAGPRAGETVQAELAARWMSTEQLDAARR